jgi:predicted Zn-dependent protease
MDRKGKSDKNHRDVKPRLLNTEPKLQPTSTGTEVKILQEYLASLGYLAVPDKGRPKIPNIHLIDFSTAPQAELGRFDDSTATALAEYQQYHGLPITGDLDKATAALMQTRRCGYPDVRLLRHESGNPWDKTALTYGFQNYTPDMQQARIQSAFSVGFNLWVAALSGIISLSFSEVNPGTTRADISISFGPFDGPNSKVAVTTVPGNTPYTETPMLFDDAETWTDLLPPKSWTTDLITFAAHECGHALGLDHINVDGALMNTITVDGQRSLSQSDINAIQNVYKTP